MAADPKQVKSIFMSALEAQPDERADILSRECGDDVDLRLRVEALLKAHEEPNSFLEQPSPGTAA